MNEKIEKMDQEKKKKLRYVAVYNRLFHMILDGVFPEGSQLPSEPDLAKQMGVSRMTLRQALSLLQDDGMVKNIRGKGNFIMRTEEKETAGLEVLQNPVYRCLQKEIQKVELEVRTEPSTEYTCQVLGRNTKTVVFADRWYHTEDGVAAYSLSVLPMETVQEENISLDMKEELLTWLERGIYEKGRRSSLQITYSEAGNFSATKYQLSRDKKFYLFKEAVYGRGEYPLLYNKYYLPVKSTQISITAKQRSLT